MTPDDPADRARFLEIYLRDHRAGADAGLRLAQRCHDHADDPHVASELTRLVADIDADRRSLATIMAGLGIDPSTVKRVAGIAAERLGRLKLNGRTVRTSPLSLLLEIEGLAGAVSMKRQLWSTLRAVVDGRDPELIDLVRRADDQLDRLRAIHERTARTLFAAAEPDGSDVAQGRSEAS